VIEVVTAPSDFVAQYSKVCNKRVSKKHRHLFRIADTMVALDNEKTGKVLEWLKDSKISTMYRRYLKLEIPDDYTGEEE
jgi:hypothetical protein